MNYTNVTPSTLPAPTLYDLGLTTNYAVITDEPTEVVLDNTTASLDQQELITKRRRKVARVTTDLNIQYPCPNPSAVSYAYQVEEVVREVHPVLGNIDHPVKMYLVVLHDLSGAITDAALDESFRRLQSTIRRDANGQFLFLNDARGALRP